MTDRPLVLTMGEPAGIGGEITLKAWLARDKQGLTSFFVLDDPERLRRVAEMMDLPVPVASIDSPERVADTFRSALPVLPLSRDVQTQPGKPDPDAAGLVIEAIEKAVAFCLDGQASGLVTNPINKADLYAAGFRHPGHTEFIAELCGTDDPVMMLAGPELRAIPATVHCPLSDVPGRLTVAGLARLGRTTAAALQRGFGVEAPRLAFAGLNPHAGEGGSIGREDRDIIAPAIAELQAEGINAFGPVPADSMFHPDARATYDAAICMYHDQALIPVKTLDFHRTVNVTLGLPVIRTSPDHGTAYDIAGKGIARADSLIAAIRMAREMARNRR